VGRPTPLPFFSLFLRKRLAVVWGCIHAAPRASPWPAPAWPPLGSAAVRHARRLAHSGEPPGHPAALSVRLSVLSTLVPTAPPEGSPPMSSDRRSSSPAWLRLTGGAWLTPRPSCSAWCRIWGTRSVFGSVFKENDF
jgi:hypothetical protein